MACSSGSPRFHCDLHVILLVVGFSLCLSVVLDVETVGTLAECHLKNSSHGVIADCHRLGLRHVPKNLPRGVTALDLSFNNLTALQNDSFQDVPNLITLNLNQNPIFSVQSKTFWPLTMLRNLILSRNNLLSLPPTVFLRNTLLTQVLLAYNYFSTVPHEALSALPHLLSVELKANKIERLNFEGCLHWSHIEEINLNNNEVEEIHQDDFLSLQNTTVNKLSLISNKIKILQPQSFSYLNSLELLQLDGNQIHSFDIQPFLGMTYVNQLSVYGSQIHEISPPHFATNLSMTYPNISTLIISSNSIDTVPKDAFWGFTALQELALTLNKIRTITNQSFCRLESLIELDISGNKITSFPNGTFACLRNLKRLNASGNTLQALSPVYFDGMSTISALFLSDNRIYKLNDDQQIWTIETLLVLDISYNALIGVSQGRFNGLSNLQVLNISGNNINYYSYKAFSDLTSLKELYLEKEKATFLEETFCKLHTLFILDISNANIQISPKSIEQFSGMSSLKELRMENARLENNDLYDNDKNQSLFTGLFSLLKLRIKDNMLHDLDVRVFQNLPHLVYLDMTNSRIDTLRSGVFSPLSSLKYLYLGENNLVEIAGDVFNGLYYLNVLDFQDNVLSNLDPKTFAQNPKLTDLYLPGNQISTIKPGTLLPANTSLRFDISRNPFTCTCSLAWFRRWLDSAEIDFKHADQTLCSGTSLKGLAKQPILSFHPEDHCGVNIFLIVGISLTGILIGLITTLAYKKRWWLNHKFFLLKLAIVGYEEMEEDFNANNYQFQLNLMFHEAEEEWVNEVMKPGLEERLPHLQNIIYGDEDLHLGMYYIEALYDAIENSFKTVLLISNQSTGDAWCMTKLRMALEHLNDTGLDKIILVFVEEVEDDHLPYLVRLFLSRNKPYMLWTDDEDGQELFWAQFEKSMRANRAINNAIPL